MTTIEDLAAEVAALQARVEAAEAVLAIHELKARYGDLVDARFTRGRLVDEATLAALAEEAASLFTPDGEWDGGPALGVAVGREAIAARLRDSTLTFSRHFFVRPRIRVDGDRAEGRWELLAPCTTRDGRPHWMCGVEDDEYARGSDGAWRHRRMSLTTVFMAEAGRGWPEILK
jgi:hypothetical protein